MNQFTKQLIFITLGVAIIATGILIAVAVNNRGANPVLWLRLDEGYGSSAYDASGNTNTGTLSGDTAWKNEQQCKTGKCLFFDGVGDYITVSDSAELRPIKGVTVQTWVRPNNFDSTASLILKDTQYSLDIAQGVPNFRAYVNGLWQSAIGAARGWIFREPADNQLSGDGGATFTEAFGYRALTPSNLTSEKGVLITQSDKLRYSRGSQSTPDGTNVVYENFDPYQGTLEFWVRPNWDGDDGLIHYIFSSHASGNYVRLQKRGSDVLLFDMKGNSGDYCSVSTNTSSWTAGTWYYIIAVWDTNNITNGSDYMTLYVNGSRVGGYTNALNKLVSIESILSVGRASPNLGKYQFNGTISGRILNRPITADEVTALYNSGDGHTDTFTVTPDTVWMGTYSDSTTTAAYWHTGKSVSAISAGGSEDALTTASNADGSFSDGDRVVVYDGTGYKVEGCVDGSPGSTSFDVDDCDGGDPGATEDVGVHAEFDSTVPDYFYNAAPSMSPGDGIDFYISAWVNPTAVGSTQIIFQSGLPYAWVDRAGYYFYLSDDKIGIRIDDETNTGGGSFTSDSCVAINKWQHIAVRVDRDDLAHFFYNGYAVGTANVSGYDGDLYDGAITRIGTTYTGGGNPGYSYDGKLRDIRIQVGGTQPTDAQILYQATHPLDYTASSWTLDGSRGWYTMLDSDMSSGLAASGDARGLLTAGGGNPREQEAFVSKNLIADPGMENGGISTWAGVKATMEKSSSEVKYDGQSLKVTATDTAGRLDMDLISVVAGEDYCFQGWIKPSTTNHEGRFRIYDNSNSANIAYSSYFTAASWDSWETCFEVPAGSTRIKTILDLQTSGESVYYDQLQLLPNLVNNGGMEGTYVKTGTLKVAPDWESLGGDDGSDTLASSSDEHSGTLAHEINVDIDNEGVYQNAVPLQVNEWYTASAWVKVISGMARLRVRDTVAGDLLVLDSTSASYIKISGTFKAPASIATIQIRFESQGGAANFLVDDVSIIKLDTAPASTATASNAANSFGTGQWGDTNGAFLVDGGDTLTYPTSGNINAASGTIAFWIKPNGWDGDDGIRHVLLYLGDSNDNILIKKETDDTLVIRYEESTTEKTVTYAADSSNFGANTWHHVSMTYDVAGDLKLYLDGSQVGGTTDMSAVSAFSLPVNINTGSSGSSNQADAFFDDIRIYDTVLTPTEIEAIYNDTNPTTIPANQWSHLSGVYSRDDNDIKTYVNGVLKTTYNVGSNYKLGTSTNALTIGDEFTGYLDDIKVYDEPRTASQIRSDYVSSMTARGASGRAVTIGEGSDPSQGLVAHWAMDETSANTCTGGTNDSCDSSGNGNDGAWTDDATATSTAKYGYAATFDGDGDYVSVSDSSPISLTSLITLSVWVYPATTTATTTILAKNSEYRLFTDVSGNPVCQLHNGSSWQTAATSSTALSLKTWHYITCAYDGSVLRTYVNGIERASQNLVNISNDTSNALRIGSDEAGDYNDFAGIIDNVKIYNVARSASQIRKDYETGPPPVAHWKMDENSGSTIYDTAGSNDGDLNLDDGTPAGTSSAWTTGKYGSALSFDGDDDYVSISNNPDLLRGSRTYELWFYPLFDSDSGGDYTMFHTRVDSTNSMSIYNYNNTFYGVAYKAQGSNSYVSAGSFTANNWYHLAFTVDDYTNELKIYHNGVFQATSTETNAMVAGTVSTYIGRHIAYDWTFNGFIDDVRIYNYVRTQKQIMQDMNAGHPAVGSPVGSYVGYWKFDEGYASTSYDMSISQNNGTLTGGVHWTQDGKFGSALSFDGENDYVEVSHDTSIDPDSITVMAWVKTSSGGTQQIVRKKDGASDGYKLETRANEWGFYIDTGSQIGPTISNTDDIGKWTHLVGTFDGSIVTLYVNGVFKGSQAQSGDFSNIESLTFGDRLPHLDETFTGLIDEVKIYPFALTPEEVKQEYNAGATLKLGSLSAPAFDAAGAGTSTDSAAIAYCVPGGTDQCDPPVAHWKFDERSGSTLYDTAGSNDGDLNLDSSPATSSAWKSAGHCHSGSCLSFDGTDDYVNVGNGSALDITGALTMEAWVYREGSGIDRATIIDKARGISDNGGYALSLSTTETVRVFLSDGVPPSPQFRTDDALPANQWVHVAGVWDGTTSSGSIKIYFNGVEKSGTESFYGTSLLTSVEDVFIGTYAVPAGLGNWDGKIDDVKIYDYARTPAQIAWDYNRGAPVGHWSMDSVGYAPNASSTIYDMSVSDTDNDGTFVGEIMNHGTTTAATKPTWEKARNCKYGACLDFDGVDDYIRAPDNPIYEFLEDDPFSVSVWVKLDDATRNSFDPIVAKYDSGAIGWRFGWAGNIANDPLAFVIKDGTNADWIYAGTTPVNDLAWHHIVATYDGSNAITGMAIYMDGSLLDNVDSTDETVGSMANSVWLGIGNDDKSTTEWTGKLDEVRIYNVELSATQVQALYLNNDRSAGASLEDNLVGEWRFDEGAGATMADTHYQRYGKYNYAMEFDGTDDYVIIPDSVSLSPTFSITLSAWVYANSFTNAQFLSKWKEGSATKGTFIVSLNASGNPSFLLTSDGAAGTPTITSPDVINLNEWYHIVATANGSDYMKLYVNGILKATDDTIDFNPYDSDSIITIGARPDGSKWFNGLIDDVRIYNYALTETQIKNVFNAASAVYFGPSSGLP